MCEQLGNHKQQRSAIPFPRSPTPPSQTLTRVRDADPRFAARVSLDYSGGYDWTFNRGSIEVLPSLALGIRFSWPNLSWIPLHPDSG